VEFLGGSTLDLGSLAVRPVGRVKLFERSGSPTLVRFVVANDMVLTAMTIAVHAE